MKHTAHFLITVALMLSFNFIAQTPEDTFWLPVSESSITLTGKRQIVPRKFATYSLDGIKLHTKLFSAPLEKNVRIQQSTCVISLPLPNGTMQRFRVIESPIMAEALGAAYPHMKTFSVKGIDDPYATGKLDWNDFGFHGMILSIHGDFFIDPYCVANTVDYISYYTSDFVKDPAHRIHEGDLQTGEGEHKPTFTPEEKTGAKTSVAPAVCVGAHLRTYRLAVACTGEYAVAATGISAPSVAQTLAKIVTSVNRVDGVYEKEVAVRMVLVPTETLVVFTSSATDPFTGNNNAGTLIGESQTVITNAIGNSNYDIGHTFSTGGGGLAFLGCVCNSINKARGITGSGSPVGDPYDIDYVAHEMGHQFSGNHTFNAMTGSCNGNRSGATSVEPGSGVTIMAYAGICSGNDIANNSIAYFHAISYDEIVNFTNSGFGNSCAVTTTSGNQPPLVTGSGNYIIPKSTPFVLSGSAIDPDGDVLTYSWEETDAGSSGGNWNSGSKPFFRSYVPVATPTRLFPKSSSVQSGNYTGTMGEYLPTTAQSLNFRLTARDNKMGGGGVCYANNAVTVDDSGPLSVTYPSATGITWTVTTNKTITWAVNGTNMAPVSCDSVRILLSNNSGTTYSVLVNSTPNDGSELVAVPNVTANITTCRVRIESIGNVFYDIGNNNFTISTDTTHLADTVIVNPVGIKKVSASDPVALTVWPNPFNNQLHFTASNLNIKTITAVSVNDILGNTLMQLNFTGKSELNEMLDFSSLSAGVYFIKVKNDAKQSVHRVVKE